MAKISDNYEVVYIIDPNQGEEAIAPTVFWALPTASCVP